MLVAGKQLREAIGRHTGRIDPSDADVPCLDLLA